MVYSMDMNYFQSFILSVVEGVTEFLPISSTGHLILASTILKIQETDFVKTFEIFIQLGAILAVIFLYRKTILEKKGYWKKIIVAFIPTGILGVVLYKFIKKYLLGNSLVVVLSLFIGGIILILIEMYLAKNKKERVPMDNLSYKNALVIGGFQSLSMIPGVSRAAATIVGGLLLGMGRESAVEFSFLLAVPTMLAATGLDLVKSHISFSSQELILLGIGFTGAFITAIFAIRYLIGFVKKHTFIPFGIYRIIVAVVFYLFMMG